MAVRGRKKRKNQNRTHFLALGLVGAGLLIFGVVALLVLPQPEPATERPRFVTPVTVNFQAPALELTNLQGSPVSLADFRGEVVLVNNWATWCPPCKAEMPTLQAYYEAHREQGFTIVAIEAGQPPIEVADFVKSYGLTFPVWPDPTQKATAAFKNPGLPNSYVIDRGGTVRLAWTGAIDRQTLEKFVTPLLED